MKNTLLACTFLSLTFLVGCNNSSNTATETHATDTTKAKTPVNTLTVTPNSTQVKDSVKEDTVAEGKIYEAIEKLPEIKKFFNLVDSVNHGTHKAMMMIGSTPTKDEPYYWVQVGEDNGVSFVTEYNFYVSYPSMNIRFYDTVNDTAISLQEWRKQGNKM